MKKISILLAGLFLVFSFTSCVNEASLQSYLVKSQDKAGFITFDIPASVLQLRSDGASAEAKKALNSLKKINIVAMLYQDNAAELKAEKETIQKILKSSNYKSLMRFNQSDMKVSLYYTGEADAIDEIIAFGYGAKQGVGIARILGDNINPGEIIKMMKDVKF
ncbi:MAG: DUF4252 domain-containing protein, partial [Flavobacteriaceae bacterium]|nr:DUF4252 domain-containing protein [Flavobacteriaceae bacterium]